MVLVLGGRVGCVFLILDGINLDAGKMAYMWLASV